MEENSIESISTPTAHIFTSDYEIVEKFLRNDRWYVKLDIPLNNLLIWKNAQFIWLQGNPAFQSIPKGYVIHHLDGNQLNDDISNLVLMHRYHHLAYHSKFQTIQTKISIDLNHSEDKFYNPYTEPKIYKPKNRKYYRIWFWERNEITGKSHKTTINSWKRQHIASLEMAEKIKSLIWKQS